MTFTDRSSLEKNLRKLTDSELLHQTGTAAKKEQAATLDLLAHLNEVNVRKVFATLGHSSLWKFV